MTARLLVVDDEPRTAELTAELLRRAGYVVEIAVSGSAALQSVRSSSPDLMLLDYEMPDMEAPEVLDSLRSGADRIAFPVIILTGGGPYGNGRRSRACWSAGVYGLTWRAVRRGSVSVP